MLARAREKEGGVEPAVLAWVLGDFPLGPGAPLPPETSASDLDAFRRELVQRLSRMALPPK